MNEPIVLEPGITVKCQGCADIVGYTRTCHTPPPIYCERCAEVKWNDQVKR